MVLFRQAIIILVLVGCARMTSLNMQSHEFGAKPQRIIWFQVAGFDDQILSITKFNDPSDANTFSKFNCYGRTWGYNLFKIRPNSFNGFHSEITGKKNVKKSCDNFSQKPIWQYLKENGYTNIILENPNRKSQSLLKSNKCESSRFLTGASLFSMSKAPSQSSYFHTSDSVQQLSEKTYYDSSCQKGNCFSSLSDNVIHLYNEHLKDKSQYLYLIRDFKLESAIVSGNDRKMRGKLLELNTMLKYFMAQQANDDNMTIIVTSSAPISLNLPPQGQGWKDLGFGKRLDSKTRMLNAPVLAKGARAENFCGMYEQSEILSRIFQGPKEQGLKWTFFNPF